MHGVLLLVLEVRMVEVLRGGRHRHHRHRHGEMAAAAAAAAAAAVVVVPPKVKPCAPRRDNPLPWQRCQWW